jgi:putative ABC transport system ATP-binding protein
MVKKDNSMTIELRDIQFRWKSFEPPLLHIPKLEIHKRDQVFIEGPSGSGKSSLLSLIAGLTSPERGRVSILGKDIVAMNGFKRDQFRAAHIGFIFQTFNLIPYLSVLENILLPCTFSKVRRIRALQQGTTLIEAALKVLKQLHLDDLSTKKANELSVGQQQRVAMARALLGDPELIIADEPTSALDERAKQNFLTLLKEQCQRTQATLIFVSHDHHLKKQFNRIIPLAKLNKVTKQ